MGGMTSLIAEGERGQLARGLVLVDIVARLEPLGVERIQAFMSAAPDGFATLAEAADAIAAYNPHRPRPKKLDRLRKNLVQREDSRWRWDPGFLRVGSEPEREIRQERAQRAAQSSCVPTLLVRGAHSDIVSAEGLREMQELIPHVQTVEVASAGHMIAGDDNDVFTAQLTRFVESTSPLPAPEHPERRNDLGDRKALNVPSDPVITCTLAARRYSAGSRRVTVTLDRSNRRRVRVRKNSGG